MPAILEVAASGLGVTYQWKKNGGDVPGETRQTLIFDSLQGGQAGNYSCVVSTTAASVSSATVTVSVITTPTAPTITVQPKSLTNALASTAIFSAAAVGNRALEFPMEFQRCSPLR